MRLPLRFVSAFAVIAIALASSSASAMQRETSASPLIQWQAPVPRVQVVDPFLAPADPYAPGHRGVDLAAPVGSPLRAPAAGTVAFSGTVADRNVITIEHGSGYVSTLEPVEHALETGTAVAAGEVVAAVGVGGHSPNGSVHFGVRLRGHYINPLLLVGEPPRAVLLPCC